MLRRETFQISVFPNSRGFLNFVSGAVARCLTALAKKPQGTKMRHGGCFGSLESLQNR
jgi:hypothetical protein